MLSLTRTLGTGVKITTQNGEVIKVYLTSIRGKQVRLGVVAEDKTSVDRLDISGKTEKRPSAVEANIKVKR